MPAGPQGLGAYVEALDNLSEGYGEVMPSAKMAREALDELSATEIEAIFRQGLHEFLTGFIARNNAIGMQIEADYRFNA